MSTARAKEAVDAAMTSCERVTDRARQVTDAIKSRQARARTNPFMKVDGDFDDEDSLVTSIENVIATSKKEE